METKIKMVISYSLTTAYPLKWLRKKTSQHQVLGRMWSDWDTKHCSWECKMIKLFWERVWEFLKKLNIYWPRNSIHIYLLRKWKQISTKRPVLSSLSSCIQNGPKLETTQMSIDWEMDNHIVVYSYNRIIAIKRNGLLMKPSRTPWGTPRYKSLPVSPVSFL